MTSAPAHRDDENRRPNARQMRWRRSSLALAIAGLTLTLGSGCRSGGLNLFASKGPSAEALAGTGPTTTYPAPPSASATPQAIASIAGGTTGPTAGSPGPSTSLAAASANGFPGQPAGFRSGIEALSPAPANVGGSGISSGGSLASGGNSPAVPNYASSAYASKSTSPTPTAPGGVTPKPGQTASSNLASGLPSGGYALAANSPQKPASSNAETSGADSKKMGMSFPEIPLDKMAAAKIDVTKSDDSKAMGMPLPTSIGLGPAPSQEPSDGGRVAASGGSGGSGGSTSKPNGFVMPSDLGAGVGKTVSAAKSAASKIASMPAAAPQADARTAVLAPQTDRSIAPVGYTPGSIRAVGDGYPGVSAPTPKSGNSFYR